MANTSHQSNADEGYIFDTNWKHEHERLTIHEKMWDETTRHHLEALGITEGWRCLEVGAGAGSVTKMLCNYVGPNGRVVATDLDTRFLNEIKAPNLTVLKHNIVSDDLPESGFDLVHSRFLLEHIPQKDVALDRMIAALKPGGRLLIEDYDNITFVPNENATAKEKETWKSFQVVFDVVTERRGFDFKCGTRLYGMFRDHGLLKVGAEGHNMVDYGGSLGSKHLLMAFASMRRTLIAMSDAEMACFDRLMKLISDPNFSWISPLMVSAWGTKP